MALAHYIITIVYDVLTRQEEYVELGGDYYDRCNQTNGSEPAGGTEPDQAVGV